MYDRLNKGNRDLIAELNGLQGQITAFSFMLDVQQPPAGDKSKVAKQKGGAQQQGSVNASVQPSAPKNLKAPTAKSDARALFDVILGFQGWADIFEGYSTFGVSRQSTLRKAAASQINGEEPLDENGEVARAFKRYGLKPLKEYVPKASDDANMEDTG